MNDHHLDDLIIGDPGSGSRNSKGLLTIIALVVVIVIVGMILWALIFGSDTSEPVAASGTSGQQQARPLDPSLVPLDQTGREVTRPKPGPKAAPRPKSKPKATPKAKPKTTPKPKPSPTPKPRPVSHPAPAPKPAPTTPPAETTTAPAATAQTPTTPSPAKKPTLIKTSSAIYYIQVGAFKRDPDPRFLQKLKDSGFTFITKKSGDMRRVRVGPYDSYEQAKAALPEVKSKIGIDGLIIKY